MRGSSQVASSEAAGVPVMGAIVATLSAGYFWCRSHRAGDFERDGATGSVAEVAWTLDSLVFNPRA